MKRTAFGITFLLVFFGYGLILSQIDLHIIPETLTVPKTPLYYDYKGVVNVHSSISHGSSTTLEIIDAAQTAGLDFLFLTDLNQYPPDKSIEGQYQSLMVFNDGEFSFSNSRLLNLTAAKTDHLQGAAQARLSFSDMLGQDDYRDDTGLLFLAHPNKEGFEWQGEIPIGLNGIEVLNLRSHWQLTYIDSPISFLWSLVVYPFNRRMAFIRLMTIKPEKNLKLWDDLSLQRPRIGILGADARAQVRMPSGKSWAIPRYDVIFQVGTNHLLLESELTGIWDRDKPKVIKALRKGQFYFSFDLLANPEGFVAYAVDDNQKRYPIGSEVPAGSELVVRLPAKPNYPFDVIIFRNGEKFVLSNSLETQVQLPESGNYRIEVRVIPTFPPPDGKKWITWIYTNHFIVK